jgi:hypothetical protein
MRQTLVIHPGSRGDAVRHIDIDVARPRPDALTVRYTVSGDIGALRLPAVATPARTDELWRTTCFEAFVRAPSEACYCEFNFAPSTEWAAYRFDGYRRGMAALGEIDALRIDVQATDALLDVRVMLELGRLPDLAPDAPWQLGLSAVIEETNGRKSYWALAHPPGAPDFHHSDCFALEVPTA